MSDDEVRELLDRYADAQAREPAVRPERLWLVDWSHGKRLLARGDGQGAFEALERARRHALALTEENPSYSFYLWHLFEDMVPLARSGIGSIPVFVLVEECYFNTPATSAQHPWLLQVLVDSLIRRSRFTDASELLSVAREDYERTGAHPPEVADYLQASVHLAEGRPGLALPLAQGAFDTFLLGAESDVAASRARLAPYCLPALEVLVDVWMSIGNHRHITTDLPAYIEMIRDLQSEAATSRLRLALAMAQIEVSEWTEAGETLAALCSAPELPDALFVQAQSRLAFLALRLGKAAAALKHVESALARRHAEELDPEELALPLALGLRASRRSGNERSGLDRFLPELRDQFDRLVALWDEQPVVAGGLGLLRYTERRTVIGELLIGVTATEGDEAALACLVRVEATATLAKELGGRFQDLAGLREALLPPGGGLVDFFYDEDVLHVFALGSETLVHVTREELPGLGELLADYEGIVRRRPGEGDRESRRQEWAQEGHRLSDLLFPAPARAALEDWGEVRLVSTGIFGGNVSMASLPVLSDEPLGVDRAVSYLPSLAVGLGLEADPAPRPFELDLVLVTNARRPATETGPRPLHMSESEKDALLAPFPASRARCLSEGEASLPSLAAIVGRTKVLHVFEHGLYLPEEPIPAAATISPSPGHDGTLGARELLELAPLPPLVVLSVCDAGQGASRIGDEGASDLRGACLRAGAKTLVFASGSVDQLATQRLMVHLHRALAGGASPARALQHAWTELRRSEDARFDDPYYYGQIQVLGRAHEPLF